MMYTKMLKDQEPLPYKVIRAIGEIKKHSREDPTVTQIVKYMRASNETTSYAWVTVVIKHLESKENIITTYKRHIYKYVQFTNKGCEVCKAIAMIDKALNS